MTEKFIPLTIYQIMRAAPVYHATIPYDTTATIFKWILSALFMLCILLYLSFAFSKKAIGGFKMYTKETFYHENRVPSFHSVCFKYL